MSIKIKVIGSANHFMKSVFLIFYTVFLLPKQEIKAQVISYDGVFVSIAEGTIVEMDSLNIDSGTTIANEGTMNISTINNAGTTQGNGTYNIAGSFINTGTFLSGTSTVNFNGAGSTTIGGTNPIEFYNLTLNNTNVTAPQITFGIDATAKNNLTMTLGNTNLAGYTLTLGSSAVAPGTLNYTAGWLYGGTFTRWVDNVAPITIPSATGHFPMGTSAGDYRPLWHGYSAALTTGGTISVLHNPVYPSGALPASHIDSTWMGGTVLQGISTSSWDVSTANGFASSGSNISMRFGGTGFGPFTLSDLNLSLASSVVGTHTAATTDNTDFEVNRNDLSTADLLNTFHLGTSDISNTPLPLELLYFEAKCVNRKVNIAWATASEINSDYFTVEKSTEGINFETLKIVDGAGNSSQTLNYSTVDNAPFDGISYYRLKHTNLNGKTTHSNSVAVQCKDMNNSMFTVYPNPNDGAGFNLQIPNNNSLEVLVVVYDIFGREIFSKVIDASINGSDIYAVDPIQKIVAGIYLIKATTDDQIYTTRLLVQ